MPTFYYPFVEKLSLEQKVTSLFDAMEVFKNDIKTNKDTIQKRLYVRAVNTMAMRIMRTKIGKKDFYYHMYSQRYSEEYLVQVGVTFLENDKNSAKVPFILLSESTEDLQKFFESLKKRPILTKEVVLERIMDGSTPQKMPVSKDIRIKRLY